MIPEKITVIFYSKNNNENSNLKRGVFVFKLYNLEKE